MDRIGINELQRDMLKLVTKMEQEKRKEVKAEWRRSRRRRPGAPPASRNLGCGGVSIPVSEKFRHKAARCLGLPPIPVSKDRRFDEPPQTCPPHTPPVADPIHNVSTLETEAVPPISSPEANSTAINAPPSDIVCVPEATQLNTDYGFNGNITASTSVSPSSSAPLDFVTAGTLSLSTPECNSSVGGLQNSCLKLSDAKGSNRFANLAMFEEDIQLDVVSSSSQPLSPSVKTSAQFISWRSLLKTISEAKGYGMVHNQWERKAWKR
ncbi:hypothetical protein Bca101_065103 [Brassica carinata]